MDSLAPPLWSSILSPARPVYANVQLFLSVAPLIQIQIGVKARRENVGNETGQCYKNPKREPVLSTPILSLFQAEQCSSNQFVSISDIGTIYDHDSESTQQLAANILIAVAALSVLLLLVVCIAVIGRIRRLVINQMFMTVCTPALIHHPREKKGTGDKWLIIFWRGGRGVQNVQLLGNN